MTTPDDDIDTIDYEVTYPMGFVVSVHKDASTQEIIEAYTDCIEDWVQDGNFPAEDYVKIERLDAKPTTHTFTVTLSGCSREQAEQVMSERLGPDEDYGFDYTIVDWG